MRKCTGTNGHNPVEQTADGRTLQANSQPTTAPGSVSHPAHDKD